MTNLPGDHTDTPLQHDLATAAGVPWEQPVREVSLSARADTVADMAPVWQAYLTHLTAIAEQFRDIWKRELLDNWTGPAADACHQRWIEVTTEFFKVVDNYGTSGAAGTGVPGLLSDTATAIHDAIGAIPIPVFGSSTENSSGQAVLPNNRAVSRAGGTGWGDELYADYQSGPDSYRDGAFLARALSGMTSQHGRATYGDVPAGSRLRPSSSGQYDVGDTSQQVTANHGARQDHSYEAAVRAWYTTNQRLAYTAYNDLLNTYARHETAVPDQVLRINDPAAPKTMPPHGTKPTGFDPTGTGVAFSGPAGAGAGSAGLPGVTPPGAAVPVSSAGSMPDTTPVSTSDLSGVGGSGPTGVSDPGLGAAAEPGPGLGAGSGYGGGADVGVAPGVGFSPSSEAWPGEAAGVAPDLLDRGSAGIAGANASPPRDLADPAGMGMMGSGSSGASRERDEHKSWLTEDQDIWGLIDDRDLPDLT